MDAEFCQLIEEEQNKLCQWKQNGFFRDQDELVNIFVATGDKRCTPTNASNQPRHYPPSSVYQFPSVYRGPQSLIDLHRELCKACTGCNIIKQNSYNRNGETVVTYRCSKYKLQPKESPTDFKEGRFMKDGIKKETIKNRKSNNNATAFERMNSLKMKPKGKLTADRRGSTVVKPIGTDKKARYRSGSGRAIDAEHRCNMFVKIFMHRNGFWYLDYNSDLNHTGHVQEETTTINKSNVQESDRMMIEAMYNHGIPFNTIAEIMTAAGSNESKGQFLASTIRSITDDIQRAIDEISGVDHDWSSAQKTINNLNSMLTPNGEYAVSHVALTMRSDGDLVVWTNKGRPTESERVIRSCPKKLRRELNRLKKQMNYEDGTEILLALSIATDEMARHVAMFPEVFYMDVTSKTNRQKRELFLMVVKDASGEAFVGNATIIPSQQRWVFQKIYQSFFVELYGEKIIQRNRLALTDDDQSEYGPFENSIKTIDCYSESTHMLCVFHAVVMAFYEKVYPHLPNNGKKGAAKKLTPVGELYGMLLYLWFLSMSTEIETKDEYDRSHVELAKFLDLKETRAALPIDCRNAAIKLQLHLRSKEFKLANYQRMDIRNCMDACTTSPVESNNNAIKHGGHAINANMHLDRSTKLMLSGINARLRRRKNMSVKELNRTNRHSNAPTKHQIIEKGQRLADRFHDERVFHKSAQIGPMHWWVWNFDRYDHVEIKDPISLYLPTFMRVRDVQLVEIDGKYFVRCSCGGRKRYGCPCTEFFCIADHAGVTSNDIMDMAMFDVRYWKIFNAKFGEDSDLGKLLEEAQARDFAHEHCGIHVSEELATTIMGKMGSSYPILSPGTTERDFDEAVFVDGCKACTMFDLEFFRIDEGTDLTGPNASYDKEQIALSKYTKRLQDGIEEAERKVHHTTIDRHDRRELRKDLITMVDQCLNEEMADEDMIQKFADCVRMGQDNLISAVNSKWGKKGGGENKLEWFGKTGDVHSPEKRYRGVM